MIEKFSKIETFLDNLYDIKTKVGNVVSLSAAEIEHLRICKLPFQCDIFNPYVHGSILFDDKERYSTLLSDPYREILKMGYQLAQCMTGFKFCDFRTSSALHALQISILALTNESDVILYPSREHGGHSSYHQVIATLGRKPIPLNFDEEKWIPIKEQNTEAKMILMGYSEILSSSIEISMLSHFTEIPIILDGSQLSGFIFNQQWKNLNNKKVVVIGSTHKTLPLYPLGFILTNNNLFFEKIDSLIFPGFIRTTNILYQIANFIGLSVFEKISSQYIFNIHTYREKLTEQLIHEGIIPVKHPYEKHTSHQIWLKASDSSYIKIVNMMKKSNVQLDIKILPYKLGSGIRIGVQQIAADYIPDDNISQIAQLISNCYQDKFISTQIIRFIDQEKSLVAMENKIVNCLENIMKF